MRHAFSGISLRKSCRESNIRRKDSLQEDTLFNTHNISISIYIYEYLGSAAVILYKKICIRDLVLLVFSATIYLEQFLRKEAFIFLLHQSGLKSESTFGNIMCWVIFLVSSVMVVLVKLLDTSTGIAALRVRSERKLIGMRLSYSIPCAHKGFLLLKPAIINWKV